MSDKYILSSDMRPIPCDDLIEWAKWFETAKRVLKRTKKGDITVSTVFLGLDHNFGSGKPLLFETMVFGGKWDQEQWRYSTYKEAVEDHKRIVKKVFNK